MNVFSTISINPYSAESRPRTAQRVSRSGTTVFECVVAASVLMVAMGTVTTIAFRASRMWTDTRHQRVAMNELANQVEQITETDPTAIDALLVAMTPSKFALANLDRPQLTANRVRDQLGDRVTVELVWQSRYPVAPVRLTGWVQPLMEDSSS